MGLKLTVSSIIRTHCRLPPVKSTTYHVLGCAYTTKDHFSFSGFVFLDNLSIFALRPEDTFTFRPLANRFQKSGDIFVNLAKIVIRITGQSAGLSCKG